MAVPLGLELGAWPLTCVGAFDLPGVAAAASPPVRVWVGCAAGAWTGCAAFVSNGCACPAQHTLVHRSCVGHRRPISPLQNNRPLSEGGCRLQPAGGGEVHAPSPPALLTPGRYMLTTLPGVVRCLSSQKTPHRKTGGAGLIAPLYIRMRLPSARAASRPGRPGRRPGCRRGW